MINKTILKRYFMSNWRLLLIITATLCLFLLMMTFAYNQMMERLAENPTPAPTLDYTSFLANSFIGGMYLLLPMVFIIVVCNKVIASQVDKGALAMTLATKTTRNEVTITNLLGIIISLLAMFLVVFGVGLLASLGLNEGELIVLDFFKLLVGMLLLQLALSGICFFASCLFNTSAKSLALGAGLSIGFYVLNILSSIDQSVDFFKYFTIVTLYNPEDILALSFIWEYLVLGFIAIAGYIGGVIVFKYKDLPL